MTCLHTTSWGDRTPLRRPLDATTLAKVARHVAGVLAAARDSSHLRGVHQVAGGRRGGTPRPVDAQEDSTAHIEDIYREHAAAMYRAAVSVVRDHALAEDVVQDAIVKAWRHMDGFRGDSSLRTWLLRITHNTAVSTLRRLRDTPLDPARLPQAEVTGPETGTVDQMFARAFEAALFGLDETSRAAMALRELEELPYDEIATILEVPLSTVKTRLFRARRRLADDLAAWRTT